MIFFGKKTVPPSELLPATVPSPVAAAAAAPSLPLVSDMSEPLPLEAHSGFAPVPARHLITKAARLKKQLRAAERSLSLSRSRRPAVRYVIAPELAPEPLPAPAPVEPLIVASEEPPAVTPPPAPAFDAAQLTSLVAKAPALVELQYEVLDLRHEIDALKNQLAALRAQAALPPAEVKASQLTIVDPTGKKLAGISADGVVSCRMIEMHPGAA